jgi:hypothetical protein
MGSENSPLLKGVKMIDANTLLSEVNCSRGAPMGRRNVTDNPESKVLLFRMRMVDSDYDAGGAYWGSGEPMYAAIGEEFEYFLRAKDIDSAKQSILNEYPKLTIETNSVNDDFFAAYVNAALWSSGDPDAGLEFLNEKYDSDDIHPDSIKKMQDDCEQFFSKVSKYITEENCNKENHWSQAGYDFWLTRNHHGAGFWDGDWKKSAAEQLTAASHTFSECDLYVGDDGKIHC